MVGDETRTEDEPSRKATLPSVPVLLVAFDGGRPDAPSTCVSLAGAAKVVVGRGPEYAAQRVQEGARWTVRVALPDTQISREHVRLENQHGRWVACDLDSRNGSWLDGRRLSPHEPTLLPARAVLQLGRTVLLLGDEPPSRTSAEPVPAGLESRSGPFAAAVRRVSALVAAPRTTILVRGPIGSGKEVAARALHELLGRQGRTGPFLAVNCGAIPTTLVESELFGVRRGAFSGATEDRPGLVRAAEGGTLFLDEIGELGATSQAALLRVLEEREVRPVGETRARRIDVAVVAATHRDLAADVAAGRFRADLLSRLSGTELALPALRDRLEDLGPLVAAGLAGAPRISRFSAEAVRALTLHDWPFNVRELHAVLRNAAALADDEIRPEHLPPELVAGAAPPATPRTDEELRGRLERTLLRHGGNVAAAARELGEHRRQVQRWLARLAVDPSRFRR